jgi:membrane-associated phospholipid phosphatase
MMPSWKGEQRYKTSRDFKCCLVVFGTGRAFDKRWWYTVMTKLIFDTAWSGETYDRHWFQASAAMLKSVVFWVITRRRVVIVYWRFGTTYRSHLHGSRLYHTTPCNNPGDHRYDRHVFQFFPSLLSHSFITNIHTPMGTSNVSASFK